MTAQDTKTDIGLPVPSVKAHIWESLARFYGFSVSDVVNCHILCEGLHGGEQLTGVVNYFNRSTVSTAGVTHMQAQLVWLREFLEATPGVPPINWLERDLLRDIWAVELLDGVRQRSGLVAREYPWDSVFAGWLDRPDSVPAAECLCSGIFSLAGQARDLHYPHLRDRIDPTRPAWLHLDALDQFKCYIQSFLANASHVSCEGITAWKAFIHSCVDALAAPIEEYIPSVEPLVVERTEKVWHHVDRLREYDSQLREMRNAVSRKAQVSRLLRQIGQHRFFLRHEREGIEKEEFKRSLLVRLAQPRLAVMRQLLE